MKNVDQQKSENKMEKDAANRGSRWDIRCPRMLNNDLKRKDLLKILEPEKKN